MLTTQHEKLFAKARPVSGASAVAALSLVGGSLGDLLQSKHRTHSIFEAQGKMQGRRVGLRALCRWPGGRQGTASPRLTFSLATSVCTESGVHCVYDSEGEKPAALLG